MRVKEKSTTVPPQGGLTTERISRRFFGQMLGMPALLASTVTVTACGGGDDGPVAGSEVMTRAAFVASIAELFNWVHSSEYNDPYKAVQPTFVDVILGATPFAKQIEMALEESLVSNVEGYFYPDKPITREDAADIFVKAFKVPLSSTNALAGFTDAATISPAKKSSVNAMLAAGYMAGSSATLFGPATRCR